MGSRYYDSCNNGEDIGPGKISAELRKALNIADNDVPLWIYRMRALGYPPGWLKKAVVDTSDIFDTDSLDTSNTSSGQANKRKQPSNDEIQYDHSKLIDYPGFNSPMPKGCVDYHYYINMPAMLEHQQLEYAKKHMNAFKPAQLPKRSRFSNANDSLDETNTSTAVEAPVSPIDGDDAQKDETGDEGEEEKNKMDQNKSTSSLPEGIKLLSKGSPMPKPVTRAPLEKFSEGVVGELLYFENLPASTGKFDSIRGLLNTIRQPKASDQDTSSISTKSDK